MFLADGVGFEPTRPLRACRFSRPVPSTARPPIQSRPASLQPLGAEIAEFAATLQPDATEMPCFPAATFASRGRFVHAPIGQLIPPETWAGAFREAPAKFFP